MESQRSEIGSAVSALLFGRDPDNVIHTDWSGEELSGDKIGQRGAQGICARYPNRRSRAVSANQCYSAGDALQGTFPSSVGFCRRYGMFLFLNMTLADYY